MLCRQTGHYRIWVENNTSRNDSPTPFSVRLTKDGESEDKSFEDCEEMEEVDCFELYVYFALAAIVVASCLSWNCPLVSQATASVASNSKHVFVIQ